MAQMDGAAHVRRVGTHRIRQLDRSEIRGQLRAVVVKDREIVESAAADVGLRCDVVVDIANNESTRPGSDLTVSTGNESRLFPDIEATPSDAGPVTFQMVMGETVTATLTFGPNKEFDGHGFDNAAFSAAGDRNDRSVRVHKPSSCLPT